MTGPRVAVIGGGVAGLAAARRLASDASVVVLEATQRAGGKLESAELRGLPVDLGPDAFITRNPAAERLCRALGLDGELLAPSSNGVAVFTRGRLRPLPAGIVLGVPTDLGALARSRVVSPPSLLHVATDLLRRRAVLPPDALERARSGTDDPSVAAVFGPRLGQEVCRVLLDPLLGGINASDVDVLSLAAAAPQLLERVAGAPSVLRALRFEAPTFRREGGPPFLGLRGGMGELADALSRALVDSGGELCVGAAVDTVRRDREGWRVTSGAGEFLADAVLLAVPAPSAARLLGTLDPALAAELSAIPYASVVTACFAYPADAVPGSLSRRLAELVPSEQDATTPLPGSGVLVPRDGRRLVSAMTFTSTKWPRSARPGEVVVRAFAGRHRDERALGLGDEELVGRLDAEVREMLGLDTAPLGAVLRRWEGAIPQYVTGHLARVSRIRERLSAHRGLGVTGAAYGGVGIPACVADAERAADGLVASLVG